MNAEVVSPELALVCPDLRAAAIAGLPHREPDAWLNESRRIAAPSPAFGLMAALAAEETPAEDSAIPLPFALLAYTATSATRFVLEAAVFMGIVIGLLSVVTLVHA